MLSRSWRQHTAHSRASTSRKIEGLGADQRLGKHVARKVRACSSIVRLESSSPVTPSSKN